MTPVSACRELTLWQIERLRHQLSLVERHEAFLLHAGDCAESFDACTHARILASASVQRNSSLTVSVGKYLEQDRSHSVRLTHPDLGCPAASCQCPVSKTTNTVKFTFHFTFQVRIGRIAGQYAKPRSSAMEKIGDREVLSFRYSLHSCLFYSISKSTFQR